MKKTILGILLILAASVSAWAAPGDITPSTKGFGCFSSASGGRICPDFSRPTTKFTGNVTINPTTKTVNIPLQTTITGNAATATALAANGSNCSAGNYAQGVDASGNAEGCGVPAGTYSLPTATSSILGGVKPDGTSILNSTGVLSATAASVGALASGGTAVDSDKLDGQHGSYYQAALGYTAMKTDYSNAGTAPTWNQNTSGTAAGLSGAPNITVGTVNASGTMTVQGITSGTSTPTFYGGGDRWNLVADGIITFSGIGYAMLHLAEKVQTGDSALILVGNGTTHIVYATGSYSTTKDTLWNICVYIESGDLKIQNKRPDTIGITGMISKL